METLIRYRGRGFTREDVAFVRQFIAEHPEDSRWSLSRKLGAAQRGAPGHGVPGVDAHACQGRIYPASPLKAAKSPTLLAPQETYLEVD